MNIPAKFLKEILHCYKEYGKTKFTFHDHAGAYIIEAVYKTVANGDHSIEFTYIILG